MVVLFMFVRMFMCVRMIFVGMFMVVLMRMIMVFVLVMMLMHVLIFFNTIDNNMRMCAFDAALDALFEMICDTGNANGIKLFFAGVNTASKLCKRCEEHVACCAHIAFDIESLHGLTSNVVDHAGRISCTETVVDIYDSNAARA